MSMGDWKRKKMKKERKGSQTPGSAKGENCKATVQQRYMAKRSRSYKDPDYSNWCRWADNANRI